MSNKLRVVFLGTPDFAVASLKALLDAGVDVVAVVTAPDKPAGRGMKIQESPVKKYAVANHIPVLQPEKLKSEAFVEELRSFKADLQVVIAFRMLPEVVWNMPPLGTINLHASLLPDYRGAAPINWAVINGETKSGVTTFLLKHEIDTGDILFREEVAIRPDMNAGELHDRLMEAGAALIVKTVKAVADRQYTPAPQGVVSDKVAPKIFTEQCRINWDKSGEQVYNQVRGLSPYPGAFTETSWGLLKIYESRFEASQHKTKPGTMETNTEKPPYIRFATKDGWIYAKEVQLQGKRRMKTEDLLRGIRA